MTDPEAAERPVGRHGARSADRPDDRHEGERYAGDRYEGDRYEGDRHEGQRYRGQRHEDDRHEGQRYGDGRTGEPDGGFGAGIGGAGRRRARPRDLSDVDRFGLAPPVGRDADATAPMRRITDDTRPGDGWQAGATSEDAGRSPSGPPSGEHPTDRQASDGQSTDRQAAGEQPADRRASGRRASGGRRSAGGALGKAPMVAVAALVTGVLGLIPFGVAFGLIALSKLKKRPGPGRRLALGGLAFSAAWLLVIVGGVVVLMTADPGGDAGDPARGENPVSSFELAPGDCLNGLKETRAVATLPAVPCDQPHEGEVFATFQLAKGGTWPGDSAVAKQAENECVRRLAEYSAKAAADTKLEIFFLHPNDTSWKQGDREVTCVAMDTSKRRTGSLRG